MQMQVRPRMPGKWAMSLAATPRELPCRLVCGKVARIVRTNMNNALLPLLLALLTAPMLAVGADSGQPKGNYAGQTARPLRYWPVGTDFVITNGPEFFNRPLYCANSAFRVDGGDKPEFSFFLPGRGGNLRFGLKTPAGVRWLDEAQQIISVYSPGSLIYRIRDPLLGEGELRLAVLPLAEARGLAVRAELREARVPVELIFAFGGANGMKGRRGGDIGCESEPVSDFFQLQPEQCRGDEFSIATSSFLLRARTATIAGVASAGTKFAVADADQWSSLDELLNSGGTTNVLPVVVGQATFRSAYLYFALWQVDTNALLANPKELPQWFSAAAEHRHAIADRVTIETPDPFINAAMPALCVAADAIWDDRQQSFMHGAVAWRVRLLGWRGPYAGDALGWHERTAAHFAGFAREQNTNAIPEILPPADAASNLARNETALHSNGDLTKSHYDMNLVGVDAFFRHLLWTGDLDYARQMWPVIERHLAWERRLFRREFGPDKLPLYEAYAAIWASDNLQYNGGGTAHGSAYNYFENKMAARVAKLIGKDPAPYDQEAGLNPPGHAEISVARRRWPFCRVQGLPRSAAGPSKRRIVDVLSYDGFGGADAGRGLADVAMGGRAHAKIPIHGPGVPHEDLYTLPDTAWMPYQWSLNNVVMAEAAHTSLAYWQANRPNAAFALFKGCLLDSMYLGLCPGNLGAMTHFDMARGEAQRDFGDAIGITSRALVEGLFGVHPDALAGELTICPGFSDGMGSCRHPSSGFRFFIPTRWLDETLFRRIQISQVPWRCDYRSRPSEVRLRR